MDIERERGITIKAQTVRLNYRARDGKDYVLNLIDTPGHVDFAYEVNRSLAACEGSLLVVDASPGRRGADARQRLPGARQQPRGRAGAQQGRPAGGRARARCKQADRGRDRARRLRRDPHFGQDRPERARGARSHRHPRCRRPRATAAATLKALLVDSWYDSYLGVVVLVRIVDGVLKKGQRIRMMGTDAAYEVDRVGVFTPKMHRQPASSARARSASSPPRSRRWPTPASATPSPTTRKPVADAAARLPSRHPGGVLRAVPGRCRATSRTCAPPWAGCGSTTRASPTRWRPRRRSASASAAASSGSSTSRSSRSGSSASSTLDLIATAPSVIYKIKLIRRRNREIHNPVDMPDPWSRSRRSRSRGSAPPSSRRTNISAACSSSARTAAAIRSS